MNQHDIDAEREERQRRAREANRGSNRDMYVSVAIVTSIAGAAYFAWRHFFG